MTNQIILSYYLIAFKKKPKKQNVYSENDQDLGIDFSGNKCA